MDDAQVVRELERYFSTSPSELTAAYLFGSVGRGESSARSDVDVAVLFAVTPPSTLGSAADRVADDLDRLLGREVDIVTLNTAPADLVHRVLRDGKIVLDRDRPERLRFEVARRNEYFDLLPILEEYRAGSSTG